VDKDDDGVVTPEELVADWLRHDITLLQASRRPCRAAPSLPAPPRAARILEMKL